MPALGFFGLGFSITDGACSRPVSNDSLYCHPASRTSCYRAEHCMWSLWSCPTSPPLALACDSTCPHIPCQPRPKHSRGREWLTPVTEAKARPNTTNFLGFLRNRVSGIGFRIWPLPAVDGGVYGRFLASGCHGNDSAVVCGARGESNSMVEMRGKMRRKMRGKTVPSRICFSGMGNLMPRGKVWGCIRKPGGCICVEVD